MKTKGDCLALFLRYLDNATKKGVDLPVTKNADYRDKFNYFLNDAQIYIATMVKIPKVFRVTQNPIPNQLGDNGFEMKQILPGKNNVIEGIGTKSYYFELDNIGTVVISVNGSVIRTINNDTKREFKAYKGNTGAGSNDKVTFSFEGEFPYNVQNIALYGYAFPSEEDVPDYQPNVEYKVPEDFMSFDEVINKTDPGVYRAYTTYKWENNKKVILNYNDRGSFDIHYFSYPAEIKPTDPDTTPLSVEDKAIDLVVLQAGIMATAADNSSLSSWLRSMFVEKVQNIVGNELAGENSIQTVYQMM